MTGAYSGSSSSGSAPNSDRLSPWNNPSIYGRTEALVGRFSELGITGYQPRESLLQARDAVISAENAIRIQKEQNDHLKGELQKKTQELEKYLRFNAPATQKSFGGFSLDHHAERSYKVHFPVSPARDENTASLLDPQSTALHKNAFHKDEDHLLPASVGIQHYSEGGRAIGMKMTPVGLAAADDSGFTQFPLSKSFPLSRFQSEGGVPNISLSNQELTQISEISNTPRLLKQDLFLQIRENEEEILQLKKFLADYYLKESHLHKEKYALEERIASIRVAFDQQQQDLVEAAPKSIGYKQDTIEENMRLTYSLQAVKQEISTFLSSLIPLLQECHMEPPAFDAHSIVANFKFLFNKLQEKLSDIEAKSSDPLYHLVSWHSEALNTSLITPESPANSSDAVVGADWQTLGHRSHQIVSNGVAAKSFEHDSVDVTSTAGRNAVQEAPASPMVMEFNGQDKNFSEEKSPLPIYSNTVSGNGTGDRETVGFQNVREHSVHWAPGNSYLTSGQDDLNSFSPYLPPVLEEPGSSFSEAAEDDPWPAIKDLQITGEAFPGRQILACGYSINGTTSCNFAWVRHLENGSVNYVTGAKQPLYLVTADDVDSYLAIEVQPLDDRKRKGELVKVFANENRKIACDSEMQSQIEKTLSAGHKSFDISLSKDSETWEPAILAIKREGYSIKCSGQSGVIVAEKFSPSTSVEIPYGWPNEFIIQNSNGTPYLIKNVDNKLVRDTIVLTMRLFIMTALEKKKGKKRVLFFK